MCLGSRRPETFVLKAGEGISDVVIYPRDVASPDKEVVFHRKENKEPKEVHYPRGLGMARVDDGDY